MRGVPHEGMTRASFFFQMQPSGAARLALSASAGDAVDFTNNRRSDLLQLGPGAEIKLGRHVNVRLDHTLQQLNAPAGRIFRANLTQLRLVHHFSVRAFVRGIVQYRDITRNRELFVSPVEPETRQLFTQLLFSYKLNPQTVLFLGYSDNRLGLEGIDLLQTDRTLFLKLGYAWVV